MNLLQRHFIIVLSVFIYSTLFSQERNSNEVLSVKHYDGLTESLDPSVAGKIAGSRMNNGDYHSIAAKNNGSISMKSQREMAAAIGLATSVFENSYATNASPMAGPANRNTMYELLTTPDSKQYFSDIAFLDSTTLVTISYNKKNAYLLLVDISSNPMRISSVLNVPVMPACCKKGASGAKEMFYIQPTSHKIILPVNKTVETLDNNGNLSWKLSSSATPGIWIITPVKNEDKKWVLDRSQISVNYFSNPSFKVKGKDALRIQTAHSDNNGNIWMSFTNGIIGVLRTTQDKQADVLLYNFNKDASWYTDMQKRYKELLYESLKKTLDEDAPDTMNLQKSVYKFPQSFGTQYLENARFRLYSNLVRDKNSQLDSNEVFENPETLWRYVHLDLDNPMDKKKAKLTNYFGYNIRKFQTVENSIVSGNDGSVYFTTNLGLYKISYNSNTNSITVNWSVPYKNSFIKKTGQKTAASSTTPVFIEDRNEIAICDNDFPQVNMMIIDAKSGSVKQSFSMFEYGYGSACNAISYNNNTLIAGNTFGNALDIKDKDAYPSNGVMKFSSYTNGKWRADFDWNKLHYKTASNTAIPKISAEDERVYLYHRGENGTWQASSIPLSKIDVANPILYSLQPDFSGDVKSDLNNFNGNFTLGPKKSLFVGTSAGLLRIMSE